MQNELTLSSKIQKKKQRTEEMRNETEQQRAGFEEVLINKFFTGMILGLPI